MVVEQSVKSAAADGETVAALPMLPLYAVCQSPELLKSLVGFAMVKSGKWLQNLTMEDLENR